MPRNGRISAEFRSQGRFQRNRRINPTKFCTGDDADETAEFSPNFAVRDVSDETAESIPPKFALGTVPTKRPNFRQISHSSTFSTEQQNFCRILHSGTFPPKRTNFHRISHSELFSAKRPNFYQILH
ncbi:MAG: hypothetical protein Q8881_03645 [Sweet potato little leaf phytoplasma]|nr:hypothetical protein [Sweet potato little leaf phytoplasma]